MPDWKKEIRAAIASLNLEPTREAEVVEELSQHLHDRYEEMLTGGASEQSASSTLLNELNDGTLTAGLKGSIPAARPQLVAGADNNERFAAGILSDLRYGARLLLRNPAFAIVAILSLALGIGANTAIFQLLDAVRLRTLPVEAPGQLATVRMTGTDCCGGDHYAQNTLTGGLWNLLRAQQQGFSDIAGWAPERFNLGKGGEARYADTLMVSGNFFSTLGIQPVLGRLLSPSDDRAAAARKGQSSATLSGSANSADAPRRSAAPSRSTDIPFRSSASRLPAFMALKSEKNSTSPSPSALSQSSPRMALSWTIPCHGGSLPSDASSPDGPSTAHPHNSPPSLPGSIQPHSPINTMPSLARHISNSISAHFPQLPESRNFAITTKTLSGSCSLCPDSSSSSLAPTSPT